MPQSKGVFLTLIQNSLMSHKIEYAMGYYSTCAGLPQNRLNHHVIWEHVKANSEIILDGLVTQCCYNKHEMYSGAGPCNPLQNHYQNFILDSKINRKPEQRSQHWRDAGPLPCASQQSIVLSATVRADS